MIYHRRSTNCGAGPIHEAVILSGNERQARYRSALSLGQRAIVEFSAHEAGLPAYSGRHEVVEAHRGIVGTADAPGCAGREWPGSLARAYALGDVLLTQHRTAAGSHPATSTTSQSGEARCSWHRQRSAWRCSWVFATPLPPASGVTWPAARAGRWSLPPFLLMATGVSIAVRPWLVSRGRDPKTIGQVDPPAQEALIALAMYHALAVRRLRRARGAGSDRFRLAHDRVRITLGLRPIVHVAACWSIVLPPPPPWALGRWSGPGDAGLFLALDGCVVEPASIRAALTQLFFGIAPCPYYADMTHLRFALRPVVSVAVVDDPDGFGGLLPDRP